MTPSKYLSYLFILSIFFLGLFSCEEVPEEEIVAEYFTFKLDGEVQTYEAKMDFFLNLGGSYTIQANYDDTTFIRIVIPSIEEKVYLKSVDEENASITLDVLSYDSDFGINSDYVINIIEAREDMIQGEFSGRLGSFGTDFGIESVYVEVTEGEFLIRSDF